MPVTTLRRQVVILLLSVVCAAGMAYYHLWLFVPRAMEVRSAQGFGNGYSFGADFYPIWLTSREALLHHRDPYSPEMTRQIQIGLFGLIALSWRSVAASNHLFRVLLGATALALFWQWILAPVVIAMRVIVSPDLFISTVLTLPIRTAGSIPFGVLALLGLMMWRVRKQLPAAADGRESGTN